MKEIKLTFTLGMLVFAGAASADGLPAEVEFNFGNCKVTKCELIQPGMPKSINEETCNLTLSKLKLSLVGVKNNEFGGVVHYSAIWPTFDGADEVPELGRGTYRSRYTPEYDYNMGVDHDGNYRRFSISPQGKGVGIMSLLRDVISLARIEFACEHSTVD